MPFGQEPTLSAPKPTLLILGSQSTPVDSHHLHRAIAWRMIVLVRADGGSQTPHTTGGINHLIRRVLPDFLLLPSRYRRVNAQKLAV
jgi:hypothetical protein